MEVWMKKRVASKILGIVLATSMVIGNIGVPRGADTVKAAAFDTTGKTQVTDEELEKLYNEVSYRPQSVHDPSVIKVGDEYYVFGSHRAVAKTKNLTEWSSVGIDGLFGNGSGEVLDVNKAFEENLFHGNIDVNVTAADVKSISEEKENESAISTEEETAENKNTFVEETTEEETTEEDITEEQSVSDNTLEESTESESTQDQSSENEATEKESSESTSEEKESSESASTEKESSESMSTEKESSENTSTEKEFSEGTSEEKESLEGTSEEKESSESTSTKKEFSESISTEQAFNESEFCENKSIYQDLSEREGLNPNTLQENQASAEQVVTTNRTVKKKIAKANAISERNKVAIIKANESEQKTTEAGKIETKSKIKETTTQSEKKESKETTTNTTESDERETTIESTKEETEEEIMKSDNTEVESTKDKNTETESTKTENTEGNSTETENAETENTNIENTETENNITENTEMDITETEETEIEETEIEEIETEESSSSSKKTKPKKVKDNKSTEEQAAGTVSFGNFDADAWCTASDNWKLVDGGGSNLWAPDIIYNETMKKYCMYLSLNGEYHNSVVILLTAENIEGPYAYQGPVVYSGFTAQEDNPINYNNTDIKYILGEGTELPERYQKITNIELDGDGKITKAGDSWGDWWPHAIDPAVFYDDGGNLWMIYGSWSGGIYALELDENTGLRDYTVSYQSDFDEKGKSVRSDPYFGTKIAGGYYNSGEGPYIEKIGNYYYLFMSYGFYAPNGGYTMRIFRSENPDGPYADTKGTSAIYDEGKANFVASYAQDVSQIDTRGMRLMTYYQWDHMGKGEVAQGHNSALQDEDGRAYVIYHTKFNDNTAGHELRVHELFQNKNGWIVASPFAFANDTAINYNQEPQSIAGEYEIIVGDYSRGYDKDSGGGDMGGTYTGPLAEIRTMQLTDDNKITENGNEIGTWSVESGKAYATLTINNASYSGVFAEVTKDAAGMKTLCFTGVDEATGITLWGARTLGDIATIADNVYNPSYVVPTKAYGNFTLPTKGAGGAVLNWESKNQSIVSDEGVIAAQPAKDTDVTFSMTMVCGTYYYQKDYTITIVGTETLANEKYLVGKAFTNDPQDVTKKNDGSLFITNPFYISNTSGMDLSGGVSIEFDVKHNGIVNVLGALFAFNDSGAGKLYFTQGSYLGYNAKGGYYDANLKDYALVKDYIGEAITTSGGNTTAHVKIELNITGFSVYVDDKLAYDQSIIQTENGSGDIQDFANVLEWLQSSASKLYLGYGSWWNDTNANAEISNMEFYMNQPTNESAIVDSVIEALKKQIPTSTKGNLKLPTEGSYGTTIQWASSDETIIAPDGTVQAPSKATEVTLTATVSNGSTTKTEKFVITVEVPETSNIILEKDYLELTSASQIEWIDNPFYAKKLESLIVDYDITFNEGAYKTGWDGVFAFFNSKTNGRVSFQTNPYICFNEMAESNNKYIDINRPEENKLVEDLKFGQEYHFKIILKPDECKIYLDGKLALNVDQSTMSGNADFAEVLSYIAQCDKFSWGVGDKAASFWGSELSTVANICISTNESKSESMEEVSLVDEPTILDNPLFGKDLKEVILDFTVNYSENAVMGGWEGLLSFFQPETGNIGGRVSIQTVPYLCYNNADGVWMDINNPNSMKEMPVSKLEKGVDYHYRISISTSEVTMSIDGKEVEQVITQAGNPTYKQILEFISSCKKFSWGVNKDNCYWNMEKCTLKNGAITGFYSKEYTDVEEGKKKATVIVYYPDGTRKVSSVKIGSKMSKPESVGENEHGKYEILWYTDKDLTKLYDFEASVNGNISIYGKYQYEDPSIETVTVTLHYPDGTSSNMTIVVGDKLTGVSLDGEDEKGKYTIKWYEDELKTKLYDFESAVIENLNLYAEYHYEDEGNKKVTVTLYYPDGKYTTQEVATGEKLPKPESTGENENGKYEIIWYKDEAKTELYNFDSPVMENMALYGKYEYENTEIKTVSVTLRYPDGSIKMQELVIGDKLAKPESTGENENGKYEIIWYKDEAKTELYNFDAAVMENLVLYGKYQYENPGVETILVSFYYPAGTIKQETINAGDKISQPKFEATDENGKYAIMWYADEAQTILYDFAQPVTENISLYGRYYYFYEETNKDPDGTETTTKTGIHVGYIEPQEYTGKAIKPVIVVYDGATVLTEKKDYKVSYSDNKAANQSGKITITPCGNYEKASKFTIQFKIVKRELTKENVTISYKPELNVKYNGRKEVVGQTQKVTLKYGTLKVPAKDYTIKYLKKEVDKLTGEVNYQEVDKLTEEGIYQMVIQTYDNSNFNADLRYDIVVTNKILTSSLKIKVPVQDYSGKPLTPALQVTYKNKNIEQIDGKAISEMFDITYTDNTNAGTASVTLTAKEDSNYCGSKTAAFQIKGTPINRASITGFQSSQPYTGEEIRQSITLSVGGRTLTEGTDYQLGYSNHINVGKAVLTISGLGEFSGSVKKTYTIAKVNLKQAGTDMKAAFEESDNALTVAQDKSGAKPVVKVTYKDKVLVPDVDYTVSYANNKAVGSNAKVTIKGIGNYTGQLKNILTFAIEQKEISDVSIVVKAADMKYAANGKYKAKLTVYDNGAKLSASEYTVGTIENIAMEKDENGNETQCGTAQVTITGAKNYKGTKQVTIYIKKILLSSAKVTVKGNYYYANGDEITTTADMLEVTIGSGKNKETLVADKDFIIDVDGYSNNRKAGKATLTIQGIGEYGGTKTVKFKILPKWMKK